MDSTNVYVLGIESNNKIVSHIVRSKFSMRKWLTSWTDLGYTVHCRKLSKKEVKLLNNRNKPLDNS